MKPWRPYCFITGGGNVLMPPRRSKLGLVAMETTLIIERLIACQR